MKSDQNGCSTCQKGQEQYETYYSDTLRKECTQYDYRTPKGELFSCVASSLEEARNRRDKWLEKRG